MKLNSFQCPFNVLELDVSPEEFYILMRAVSKWAQGKIHTSEAYLLNGVVDFSVLRDLEKKGFLKESSQYPKNWELEDLDKKPLKLKEKALKQKFEPEKDFYSQIKENDYKNLYRFIYDLFGLPFGEEKTRTDFNKWMFGIKQICPLVKDEAGNIDFELIKKAHEHLSSAKTPDGNSFTISSPLSLKATILLIKNKTIKKKEEAAIW